MEQEHPQDELAIMEEKVAAHPDSLEDILALADAYADRGRWQESVGAYEAALALDPDNPDLLNDLGAAYEELGDKEHAQAAYLKAVSLQPDHSTAYFNLGSLYRDENNAPLAIQAFEKCITCSSDRDELSAAKQELTRLGQKNLLGAGFGVRAVAYVIDFVVSVALQYIVGGAGGLLLGVLIEVTGDRIVLGQESLQGPPFFIIGLILSILYFALLEGWFGASLGKVILRLRVVKLDGQACDIKAALIRGLYRFIDGLVFGVPAALSMRWPLQQRLGDKAAKTVVIRSGDVSAATRRPWWRFLVAAGLHLVVVTGLLVTTVYIMGTQAAQALPDLSEVVLTAEDLPPGFLNVPPSVFNLEVGEPTQGGNEIESAFAVWREEPMQVIWGFTVLLPTKADQARADEEMGRSEAWLTGVIEGVGTTAAGVLEQPALSDFRTVGAASVGLTMVLDLEGTPTRLDIFSFRRGAAGAFIYALYADGEIPVIPIDDAAQKLDNRIVEASSSR